MKVSNCCNASVDEDRRMCLDCFEPCDVIDDNQEERALIKRCLEDARLKQTERGLRNNEA